LSGYKLYYLEDEKIGYLSKVLPVLLVLILLVPVHSAASEAFVIYLDIDNDGGGRVGNIIVGDSSKPDITNTPDPTNGGGDTTNTPETTEPLPPANNEPWTGTWVGAQSWPNINLTQNGNNVTGNYGSTQSGVIESTVLGNVLTGKWTFSDGRTGMVQFTMINDGNGLEIRWTDDTTTNWLNTTSTATRLDSIDFSLIGMWRQDDTSVHRRSDWAVCQIFNADGSVIHIGIREYSNPYERIIYVALGKYCLKGDTLEVCDVTGFVMNSGSVISGTPNYSSNYLQIKNIVLSGSRSEVKELTDPNHALYSAYTSSYDHWENWNDRNDKLNIIDAHKFVTKWPLDATWGLKRVQE
jgi:hypothetical protein